MNRFIASYIAALEIYSKFQCNVSQALWNTTATAATFPIDEMNACMCGCVCASMRESKLTTANFNRRQIEINTHTLQYTLTYECIIYLGNNIYWFKFAYIRFFFGSSWISVKISLWECACLCALLTQVRNAYISVSPYLSHSRSRRWFVCVCRCIFSHHFNSQTGFSLSTCALSFIWKKNTHFFVFELTNQRVKIFYTCLICFTVCACCCSSWLLMMTTMRIGDVSSNFNAKQEMFMCPFQCDPPKNNTHISVKLMNFNQQNNQ